MKNAFGWLLLVLGMSLIFVCFFTNYVMDKDINGWGFISMIAGIVLSVTALSTYKERDAFDRFWKRNSATAKGALLGGYVGCALLYAYLLFLRPGECNGVPCFADDMVAIGGILGSVAIGMLTGLTVSMGLVSPKWFRFEWLREYDGGELFMLLGFCVTGLFTAAFAILWPYWTEYVFGPLHVPMLLVGAVTIIVALWFAGPSYAWDDVYRKYRNVMIYALSGYYIGLLFYVAYIAKRPPTFVWILDVMAVVVYLGFPAMTAFLSGDPRGR